MKHLPIHRKKLDSGLNLYFIEKKNAPVVNINLLYKVGSKDETEGMRGFAHLFEHLMFEGTQNHPKGDFDSICAKSGGTNNAYTTYDYTMYYMTMPKAYIERGLDLEADRLFNMLTDQKVLNNQISVVTEEIKQVVENQPYGKWRELQAQTAFSDNCGYAWEVHGKIEDVQNATLEKCHAFKSRYYTPKNLTLVITGDYDKEQIFRLCEKYFNRKFSDNTSEIRDNSGCSILTGRSVLYDRVPYDAAFISYHLPGFLDKTTYMADIAAFMAGKGKSSILYDNLLYEAQAVSETGAFCDKRENSSLLTFFALANDEKTSGEELVEMLTPEIEKLAENEVLDSRLEKARNQIKTATANTLLTGEGITESAAINAAFFDDPSRIFRTVEFFDEITPESQLEFSNQYIIGKEPVITIVKKK